MDKKTIFVKTQKGADELKSKAGHLFGDIKRVLVLVDNKSTVEELTKRAAPSLRASFAEILQGLAEGGYLHEKGQESAPKTATTPSAAPKASSLKMAMPGVQPQDSGEELDFTSVLPKITPQALAVEAAKAKAQVPAPAETPAKTLAQTETQKDVEARQEAEARRHAEIETARMQAGQEAAREQARLAANQAKAKADDEARSTTDAETARIKAEQEAARARAEQIAAVAKEKAEAEAKARAEAEAARLKAEQEAARAKAELAAAQAKAQAETQARAEAESARLKAEQEAAKAKAKAAQAVTQAKILAEMQALTAAQVKAEAQAKAEVQAKAEAQEQAARAKEAEARARLQAEQQEAAQAKQQLEKAAQHAAAQAALEKEKAEEKAKEKEKEKAEAEAQARKKLQAEAAAKETAPISQAVVAKLQQDKAVKAEEEARQLTQSQARKWAEAEQRAKTQAQQPESAQPVAPKSEKSAPAKTYARVRKEPRKPLPLGKIAVSLLGLAVVLALALPYVWPMQEYITRIERTLSVQLKQPVSIGHMRPGLLPLPKLELKNVAIGNSKELQAGSVVLNFSIAALFSDTRTIKRAEISELTLKAEAFGTALSALQAAATHAHFPVSQMVIHKARISGAELSLPTLSGDAFFDGKGQLTKSVLSSEDGKFTLQLQPQQSRWQVSAVIKENSLPLMPGILFNELNIKGEVSTNEANFSVIEGMLYKGKLLGGARLTWKSGWQLLGQLNVKTLAVQDIWPQSGLNGDMNGRASVTLRSASLPLLFKSPHLEGGFSVQKGYISGIDMVETARVAKRQGVSAGRTHFDELNGTLLVEGNQVQIRQLKISAGILSGTGLVDVRPGNQLSGRVNVDLKIRADMGSMPLTLSGTLTQPVWRTGP